MNPEPIADTALHPDGVLHVFRDAFEQSPALLAVVHGPDHVYTAANRAYRTTTGRPDLVGQPHCEAMPDLAAQGLTALLDQVYATGEPHADAERRVVLHIDGDEVERYYNFVYQPLFGPDGRVSDVLIHGVDLTEHVRTRRQVEMLAAQLEVERVQLNTVLQKMPAGVIIAQAPAGRMIAGNEQVAEIFRHPFTEAPGFAEYFRYYRCFHLDGRPYQEDEWPLARSISSGEVVSGEEMDIIRGDGERGTILVSSTPLSDRHGAVVGAVVIFEDITARRRAEEERERLLGESEAAVQARDEFLAIASHELRNPVTAIKGSAQLLSRLLAGGHAKPDRVAHYVDIIDRTADRLSGLVNDLLNMSRLQSGRFSIEPQEQNVAALVREAAARTGGRVRPADVPGTLHADVDADRFGQILGNLLDNAIKYSPDGTTAEVSLSADDESITLSVRDHGIGIPAGEEEHIFQPFGRASNAAARNLPGMGLGLYICRRLAEAHGGRLWAESGHDGDGTVMCLQLPRRAAQRVIPRLPVR